MAALNVAIVRLTWGFDPQAKIAAYVAAHFKDFRGQPLQWRGKATHIDDPAIEALLGERLFYAVIQRQYPVARIEGPGGLGVHNVFVLDAAGEVSRLKDLDALEAFFREHLALVKSEATAKQAVRAWLLLAEQFSQDGMFQFEIPDDGITALTPRPESEYALYAAGKAVVKAGMGNRGQVAAELTFDAAGKLKTVKTEANVQAGMRPICQATKLLDPDPIVRAMAEQDLLVMGRAAGDYLAEQRSKATPELRAAIDAIWQRILRREREFESSVD